MCVGGGGVGCWGGLGGGVGEVSGRHYFLV